ncbi:MAG TPA: DUF6785 family protein [Chthonomonadaceae bacterium]|nr:DUF6785 family protein [Chthonomonadaceae bacterium]
MPHPSTKRAVSTTPAEPQAQSAATALQAAPRPISLRSVLIALALIPPNILWVVLMERTDGRAFSTTISLFFTAVFSLLLLTAGNRLLRRFLPHRALRQGELLTIFSMVSIATAMAGVDFLSPLLTLMGHAAWFATPENGWQKFLKDLPAWLTVQDKDALKGYYLGHSSLYRAEALRAWLPPALWWTLFIMVLLWVMACLTTIVRAQWTEKERLTYPIVQLPLALTAEDGGLFRSRLFWMGFALAGGLNLVNGLHFLIPSIPAMTFNGFNAAEWFPSRPWNAIGWTPLAIFPFVVGLGYLLPVDLLFSCWFFFLFWRLEKVAASALGYMAEQPEFPYIDEQMLGGYMAICVFALWTARHHLREVWKRAQGKDSEVSDEREPMRFRTAVFGALGGFLFLVGFSYVAGLPLWLAVIFFLIYFAIAIAVTRMRAELGPPTHDLHHIGPNITLYTIIGSKNLDGPTLGVFTLYNWFNRAYRCHPMPHQLEGLKMAQVSRTASRGLLAAMQLAALAGVVATFWVTLHVSYHLGAAARIHGWSSLGFGNEGYGRLSTWLSSPTDPNRPAITAMGVGFLIATGLILIKMNVYGWPFHALGFSISGGWSMMWAWLSLCVAWALKALILRYSGLRGYRSGLPFFFGVILGDFLIGGIWTLLGLLFDMSIYSLWSG